jgi:hypothetical protein
LVTVQTELITSKTGALNPFMARQLVGRFIDLVQSQSLAGPQSVPQIGSRDQWVKLESGNFERSAWVMRQLLRELLPDDAFNAWADESRDQPRIKRAQFVLGIREANFVRNARSYDLSTAELCPKRLLLALSNSANQIVLKKGKQTRADRGAKMLVSPEIRWFWADSPPAGLESWFRAGTFPPGGGNPRRV